MKAIETIKAGGLGQAELEAEKLERDAQVQSLRAEMKVIRQMQEPHFQQTNLAAMGAASSLDQTAKVGGDLTLKAMLEKFGVEPILEFIRKHAGGIDG